MTALKAAVSVDEGACKVQGKFATGKGEITVAVDIFRMGEAAMHLVEIRRGRGDILEFHALAKQVREQLADLAAKAK
jgi:hypothetical protein